MILDGVDMVCVNLSAAAWPWVDAVCPGRSGAPRQRMRAATPISAPGLNSISVREVLPLSRFRPAGESAPLMPSCPRAASRCAQTKGTRRARPFRFQRITAGRLLLHREILAGDRLAVQRNLHLVVAGGEATRLADHEGGGLRTHRVQRLAVLVHGLTVLVGPLRRQRGMAVAHGLDRGVDRVLRREAGAAGTDLVVRIDARPDLDRTELTAALAPLAGIAAVEE